MGAVLDLSQLESAIRNPDRRTKILRQYLESLPGDALLLRSAIDGRNAGQISDAAHRIKGAAKAVGATSLAEASSVLEQSCQDGGFDGVDIQYQLILGEIARLRSAIEQVLKPSGAPATAIVDSDVEPKVNQTGGGHKVLLVDDDPRLLEIVGESLRSRGYTVLSAGSGPEALHLLEQDASVEVVLLDISMPGMGGMEVLRNIAALKNGPGVIMLTGVKDADIAQQAIRQGAFDYVVKSGDFRELASSIAACLDHAEYQKQPWWKRLF